MELLLAVKSWGKPPASSADKIDKVYLQHHNAQSHAAPVKTYSETPTAFIRLHSFDRWRIAYLDSISSHMNKGKIRFIQG